MTVPRTYRVADVARLSGVSIRALHHYDAIGLLVPTGRTEAGYRLYTDADLLRLQQIVIGRELGFPLEEIKRSLDDPRFDHRQALVEQRRRLDEKARALGDMLRAVDAALAVVDPDPQGANHGYERAVRRLRSRGARGRGRKALGRPALDESKRRTKGYTAEDWKRQQTEQGAIYAEAAAAMRRASNRRPPRRWTSRSATGCRSTNGSTRAAARCTPGWPTCTKRTSASEPRSTGPAKG
jgi:DNA-binding transcriptional MerR regulator